MKYPSTSAGGREENRGMLAKIKHQKGLQQFVRNEETNCCMFDIAWQIRRKISWHRRM